MLRKLVTSLTQKSYRSLETLPLASQVLTEAKNRNLELIQRAEHNFMENLEKDLKCMGVSGIVWNPSFIDPPTKFTDTVRALNRLYQLNALPKVCKILQEKGYYGYVVIATPTNGRELGRVITFCLGMTDPQRLATESFRYADQDRYITTIPSKVVWNGVENNLTSVTFGACHVDINDEAKI